LSDGRILPLPAAADVDLAASSLPTRVEQRVLGNCNFVTCDDDAAAFGLSLNPADVEHAACTDDALFTTLKQDAAFALYQARGFNRAGLLDH